MKTSHLLAAAAMAAFAGGAAAQPVTYENTIKGLFAERCASCHASTKGAPTMEEFEKDKEAWKEKRKGPKLDDYASAMIMVNGADAGALMRRLDDGKNAKEGKPGNMYNYLGNNAKERAQRLGLVKTWVGNWTLKRRNELSDAELAAITAPEK
jgi:mono/diheme cytochrome c family protein